jgi:hypothetical protein
VEVSVHCSVENSGLFNHVTPSATFVYANEDENRSESDQNYLPNQRISRVMTSVSDQKEIPNNTNDQTRSTQPLALTFQSGLNTTCMLSSVYIYNVD